MTTRMVLDVDGGDTLNAVRNFLGSLLELDVVDALLVPLEVPGADRVEPTLVKQRDELDRANPLAPVMYVNAASVLAQLQPTFGPQRVGAVMRPCEVRAAIELGKYGSLDLGRLILIGMDCMGTYDPSDYAQMARACLRHRSPTDEMLRWTRQGPIAPYRLRNACQMCEHFSPESTDVAIDLIGMPVRERLVIESRDDLAGQLGLPAGEVGGRDKALARLYLLRHDRHERAVAEAAHVVGDLPSLVGLIAPCTACGECVKACPLFETSPFTPRLPLGAHADHLRDSSAGEGWVERLQNLGAMGDLIAWGLHAASCVQCGMCESVCPRHVPLTAIQSVLGRRVQEEFDYVPGRSVTERLPWEAGTVPASGRRRPAPTTSTRRGGGNPRGWTSPETPLSWCI